MVASKITLEDVQQAYDDNKLIGILNLLGEDDRGEIRVTKSRAVGTKIFDFLENQNQCNLQTNQSVPDGSSTK